MRDDREHSIGQIAYRRDNSVRRFLVNRVNRHAVDGADSEKNVCHGRLSFQLVNVLYLVSKILTR